MLCSAWFRFAVSGQQSSVESSCVQLSCDKLSFVAPAVSSIDGFRNVVLSHGLLGQQCQATASLGKFSWASSVKFGFARFSRVPLSPV